MHHIFTSGHCVFCGIDAMDWAVYGPEHCPSREEEPLVYSVGPDGVESNADFDPPNYGLPEEDLAYWREFEKKSE